MLAICFVVAFIRQVWDVDSGKCLATLRGHKTELVCLCFDHQNSLLATGSMDRTAKLWSLNDYREVATLQGHTAEIISMCFNQDSTIIATGEACTAQDGVCGCE